MGNRPRCLLLALTLLLLGGCGGGATTTVIEKTVVQTTPTTASTATTPPTTTTPPSGKPERCADVPGIGPTGAQPAPAVNVMVTYTDCATATRLAHDFYPVWIRSGAAPGQFVTVDEFRCGELRDSGGFTARIVCNRSASSVTFDVQ